MPGLSGEIYSDSDVIEVLDASGLLMLANMLTDDEKLAIDNIPLTAIEGDISLDTEDLGL